MSLSNTKKRDAQSPLSGDEEDLKRRVIGDDFPVLVTLDDIDEEGDQPEAESGLALLLKQEEEIKPSEDSSMGKKVDSLIGRMDRFMNCFADLHTTVTKNQRSNDLKFSRLESAHNELAVKTASSTSNNRNRIEALEAQLKESATTNSLLLDRITRLEEKQARGEMQQGRINDQQARDLRKLEIEQGFTNKNVLDCFTETKERKMIISGMNEAPGENTNSVALGCINKIIGAAIASKQPDSELGGLKKLSLSAIDNVFRVGKAGRNRRRNISLTFLRVTDKEMVYRAKMDSKDDDGIKFYLSDDVSLDGRTLKAKLRRIVAVAKEQGSFSKLSGNKVIVGTRAYASNELHLLPGNIRDNLKQEKSIDDGIVYRGELSILSNFYPAPFVWEEQAYAHVEQFFQYTKALHHGEPEVAERIMELSNPLRIKALGDSIEGNSDWTQRRMLVLYDGVRSKFEQNLTLQEELLSTHGKHLYEATTDTYYGCGIGYDSDRWQKKNWTGENVAGLVLKKVRDELLGVEPDQPSVNNTLVEIASQEDASLVDDMETNEVTATESTSASQGSGTNPPLHTGSQTLTDTPLDSPIRDQYTSQSQSQSHEYSSNSYRGRSRGKGRGKGRGRGRGARGNQANFAHTPTSRGNPMSAADRSFLGIPDKRSQKDKNKARNNEHFTSSSPKPKVLVNQSAWLSLTEDQKKALSLLGLAPNFSAIE